MHSDSERIARLEQQVAQLQAIVADLCEQVADDEVEPERDLDGNIIPRFPASDPHAGL